jgi:hypothetical protein
VKSVLALVLLATPVVAGDYPVKGFWDRTSISGQYEPCTTPDSPEIQRERGYSYAQGLIDGFQWALDSIHDPYGIEGWGCPRDGEKPVRNDQVIRWSDIKSQAKPRPYSDKESHEDGEVLASPETELEFPQTEKELRRVCE